MISKKNSIRKHALISTLQTHASINVIMRTHAHILTTISDFLKIVRYFLILKNIGSNNNKGHRSSPWQYVVQLNSKQPTSKRHPHASTVPSFSLCVLVWLLAQAWVAVSWAVHDKLLPLILLDNFLQQDHGSIVNKTHNPVFFNPALKYTQVSLFSPDNLNSFFLKTKQ